MSIQAEITGDTAELLKKLQSMKQINVRGVLNGIAEGLRTSTVERFRSEESPEGKKWQTSIRAKESGGKTLTDTTQLKNSIRTEVSNKGLVVGTNDIRATTLQMGDTRTIRAKNGKYLSFRIGGQWRRVESVKITIPARPYLGVSKEDEAEIKEQIDLIYQEKL